MNLERVQKIAEAVLYEGYMLYPYRRSAVKNQQRWNFGVLCPQVYCHAQPESENWMMQTQCLVHGRSSARLTARVRFLQITHRSIGRLRTSLRELDREAEPEFEPVDQLGASGQIYLPWQEAAEREVLLGPVELAIGGSNRTWPFAFAAARNLEPIRDEGGLIVGVIVRESEPITGSSEFAWETSADGVMKVTLRIRNLTPACLPWGCSRELVLPHSFLSVHAVLGIEDGEFVSLLDPPPDLKLLAESCTQLGAWPVLVGEEGDRDTMLASPIILYDYPQVAPESPGSLFDGTEIDEILSLRILTMTDDEKSEMRRSDEHARQILERTESLPPEQFMKLHGILRELRPTGNAALEKAQ